VVFKKEGKMKRGKDRPVKSGKADFEKYEKPILTKYRKLNVGITISAQLATTAACSSPG
jgi:hypothetical protein